jgi:toxin ParE1/3/4
VKVRFAKTAQISFQSAINFIHQDNPTAASKFYERVEKTLRRLEKYPSSGRMIPEFPQLPYREIMVLPYRFFYRVEGKTVFIVAVLHTAQIPREPAK